MSIISPATIGAGFALVAAIGFPFAITTTTSEKKPPSISIALASAASPTPVAQPNPYRNERLLPSAATDGHSNGCGMKKDVDVCSMEFVETHMPQYLVRSFE